MSQTIQVMVADSCPVMRAGIKHFLETSAAMTVICETGSDQDILPLVEKHRPDALILDLVLVDRPHFHLINQAQAQHPQLRVIVLSTDNSEASVAQILASGANGCLLKDEISLQIGDAVRQTVQTGESWFSCAMTAKLLSHTEVRALAASPHLLTDIEVRILHLMASGHNNQRIADILNLSGSTIKNYVSKMYAKIRVQTRAEAVAWGWQQGILRR